MNIIYFIYNDLLCVTGELFKKLDEKPKLEATRLGKSGSPGLSSVWLRPVKVPPSSSTNVHQINQRV